MNTVQKKSSFLNHIKAFRNHYGNDLIILLARIGLATTFWLSGQSKVDGLKVNVLGGPPLTLGWPEISSGAVSLFKDEHCLPFIPPTITAIMAAGAEHLFSFLIIIGLATRISAAGLLAMTIVIEIFVYPEAWPTHTIWACAALVLIFHGAGKISLDTLVLRSVQKNKSRRIRHLP